MEKAIALVTGGSRGIGRAICIALGVAGYHVAVNFKTNREAAGETLDLIRRAGGEGELCGFDVSDPMGSSTAISELISRYKNISALVNNAGVTADGLFPMMSAENWDSVISTSLGGFFNVTRPVIRSMMPLRKGSIITISSVSGVIGNSGQTNYSAAKAGLIGACKALSKEVARLGIRVNVVAPGLIMTDMTANLPVSEVKKMIPMNRIGSPEEVASVVRFLCSDDASYVTGQVIGVNGGIC